MSSNLRIESIPLAKIYASPHQMRRHFDEDALVALAQSMEQEGLLQPVTVRPVGSAFELVAGERRFRAAQRLGWITMDARVLEIGDESAAIKGLIENLQRADLNPIAEARSFQQLITPPYCLSAEAIANRVGRSIRAIERSLSLLAWPQEIQEMVARGHLRDGHLKVLKMVEDRSTQIALAHKASREEWTIKETERQVAEWMASAGMTPRAARPAKAIDTDPLQPLWDRLKERPGWDVRYCGKGRWRFEITAGDADPETVLREFSMRLLSTVKAPSVVKRPSKKSRRP